MRLTQTIQALKVFSIIEQQLIANKPIRDYFTQGAVHGTRTRLLTPFF